MNPFSEPLPGAALDLALGGDRTFYRKDGGGFGYRAGPGTPFVNGTDDVRKLQFCTDGSRCVFLIGGDVYVQPDVASSPDLVTGKIQVSGLSGVVAVAMSGDGQTISVVTTRYITTDSTIRGRGQNTVSQLIATTFAVGTTVDLLETRYLEDIQTSMSFTVHGGALDSERQFWMYTNTDGQYVQSTYLSFLSAGEVQVKKGIDAKSGVCMCLDEQKKRLYVAEPGKGIYYYDLAEDSTREYLGIHQDVLFWQSIHAAGDTVVAFSQYRFNTLDPSRRPGTAYVTEVSNTVDVTEAVEAVEAVGLTSSRLVLQSDLGGPLEQDGDVWEIDPPPPPAPPAPPDPPDPVPWWWWVIIGFGVLILVLVLVWLIKFIQINGTALPRSEG